jgi:DNA-binding CsgD family transcriptional regulator
VKGRRPRPSRSHRTLGAKRQRVTQETIDEMADLRRQGLTHKEIGERRGCSERTSRRYVGKVEPQLQLPERNPEPEAEAPRQMRERFASEVLEILHGDERLRSFTLRWRKVDEDTQEAIWGGPPSILFLSEAERLIRERLDGLGDLALKLLARDKQSQHRFLREVIGYLYQDYVAWHQFAQNFGETGEDWRPPQERPPSEEIDEDDLDHL